MSEKNASRYPFGTEGLVANIRETHTRQDIHLLIERLQELAADKRGDGSMDYAVKKKKDTEE